MRLGQQRGTVEEVEHFDDESEQDLAATASFRIHDEGVRFEVNDPWDQMYAKLSWVQWDRMVKFVEEMRGMIRAGQFHVRVTEQPTPQKLEAPNDSGNLT